MMRGVVFFCSSYISIKKKHTPSVVVVVVVVVEECWLQFGICKFICDEGDDE